MFNAGRGTILNASDPEVTVTPAESNILRVEYTPIIMIKGGGVHVWLKIMLR